MREGIYLEANQKRQADPSFKMSFSWGSILVLNGGETASGQTLGSNSKQPFVSSRKPTFGTESNHRECKFSSKSILRGRSHDRIREKHIANLDLRFLRWSSERIIIETRSAKMTRHTSNQARQL